ncbi:MAG: XylR family transcriptional regulator [Verrucomicrobia bacterium]|nr:XylR family transcriptional regulator [Verrucomicrobiota bacterium]
MDRIPKVILLLESSRASGRELLRGIADFARYHGPWSFYWEPRGLEAVWPRLKNLEVDGIILRDVEAVDEIVRRGVPAVVVGHSKQEVPGVANVLPDDITIGRMAAEHLLDCGLKEFAFCGLGDKPWSMLRAESFLKRLEEEGFAAHFYRLPKAFKKATWQSERRLMAEWLEGLPKPVGVMGCNDDRSVQVIEACKVAELRVPDEVAVIGVDNDELVCRLSDPPMSSVGVNFARAGYESAQLLDQLMRGTAPADAKISAQATHVMARQSTDILFMEDPQVVKALRFIRAKCNSIIHVDQVANYAGLSRRVLEKRFKENLGRSVLSEIRRVRVERICRLLVETNMPISQIALSLGYEDVRHIARYFEREKKMTPLEYRKRKGMK